MKYFRRNIIAGFVAVLFAFGCCAEEKNMSKVTVESSKVLIAYYSYSGNTGYAAGQIQKATGGTLFEIKPERAYPADYDACVALAKTECRNGIKPKLANKLEDFDKYEVIFVGSPNWWNTIAPPVLTFLTSYDFKGKVVIPFVTHGGGGMSGCETAIKKACPQAIFLPGKAFSGRSIKSADADLMEFANARIRLKK